MKSKIIFFILLIFAFVSTFALLENFAQEEKDTTKAEAAAETKAEVKGKKAGEVAAKQDKQREFIGLKKCRMCHMSSKSGAQYKEWKAGPHAKAFETLGTPQSKKIASEMGIDNPQEADQCLKCHVTGYGLEEKFIADLDMENGVTCESCHGAGADYYKKSTMEDLTMGKIEPASVGLVMPTEEVCMTCHNEESPTYKEFHFEERVKEIAHTFPDGYLEEEGYPVDK